MKIGELVDFLPKTELGEKMKRMVENGDHSDANVFWLIQELELSHARELANIDDIQQMDSMLQQANEKIEKLQKQLDAKIMFVSNGMEEAHWALQEENIRLKECISKGRAPAYSDADDQY